MTLVQDRSTGYLLVFFEWVRINLPPHDLPVTILIAFEASFSNLNLTKPNPLFLLVVQSTGMKESTILPTLQNIASNSTLEISLGRLDTYKEKELYLRAKMYGGRGPNCLSLLGFFHRWSFFSIPIKFNCPGHEKEDDNFSVIDSSTT